MSGTSAAPEGITNPPIDELLDRGRLQVRAGDLRRQARPPDQRLLLPARRGPARVRRPAGRDRTCRRSRCRSRCARSTRGLLDRRGPPRADGRRPATGARPARRRSASAAASPPTRSCELLRLLTEAGHEVRVVPDRGRAAVRRRGHLGGAVRPPGRHRRLRRRPRGAARPASARRPTSSSSPRPPPTCSPGPPPGCADDLLTAPCSPRAARCCSPRHAHRDVGAPGHRGQRRDAARAAAPSCSSPAVGRLTGADTGPGRLPEPERDRRRSAELLAGRGADALPRDLAGRRVRRHRRRHPGAARPGPLPRQPLLRPAGLRAGPRPRPPAAPRSPWSRPTSRCPTRPGSRSSGSARRAELRDACSTAAAEAPTRS